MTGRLSSALETWFSGRQQRDQRRAGLSFRNVNCYGIVSSDLYQPTVASYALALPKRLVSLWTRRRGQNVHILQDMEGLVRPGEMLLVLGRPGSGCSTFLKTMAGDTNGFHVGDGKNISYGGYSYEEMHKERPAERIYLAELDVHFPELTVSETLEFAASARPSDTGSSNKDAARLVSEAVTSLFYLKGASKTQIGDAMIRGVSGGEKRRTSLAEAFISDAQFQFWDNSTRGLDSLTALRFVELLRTSSTTLQSTVTMTLYQASEAMYENFDKVMLLYQGRQIYFGPAQAAVEYFTNMGFVKPDRVTTADFLTSLTNPAERIVREDMNGIAPRSPDEFASVWKHSVEAQALREEIDAFNEEHARGQGPRGNDDNRVQETAESNTPRSQMPPSYAISVYEQIRICISRGFLRLRNNYVPTVSAVVANAIIAVVIGTVFYNLDETTDSMEQRAVLLFFASLQTAMTPAFEVAAMWAQRPIVEKHDRYAFYHPSVEMFAAIMVSMPQRIVESLLFQIPIYFMSNLRRTASAFFTYWLFMFATVLAMSMLFRMVGSLSRTIEQTLAPVCTLVLFSVVYTGYVVPPDYMVPWLGWIRWINPVSYTYESLVINEFNDRSFYCTSLVPSGPSYNQVGLQEQVCSSVGAVPGQPDVQGSAYMSVKFGYVASHLWRNLGILIAMIVFFCTIHLAASEYIRAQRSRGEVLLFKRGRSSVVPLKRQPEDGEAAMPKTFAQDKNSLVTQNPVHDNATDEKGDRALQDSAAETIQRQSAIFHWKHLNYDIKTSEGTRRILNDVNGWVKPGTLTAMMGVTGAGKTSLLDVLSGRTSSGTVTGDIYINDKMRDASFGRRIGYMQQEDIHLHTTTVREALEFSASLRQSSVDKAYIDTVLKMLDMESYAHAIVGVPGEGLNIEQRRRLTIAVELVAKPELLLFLDEPTSGLDSQTAWSICMLLRKLADGGQAILCTLHQPSSQLFQIFDRLLLLGQGGEQLYFGDIGPEGSTVINHFEACGAPECPPGANPAEWVMEITQGPAHALKEQDEQQDADDDGFTTWAQRWHLSDEKEAVVRYLDHLQHVPAENETTTMLSQHRDGYAASFSRQLGFVVGRNFQEYWRDPVSLYSKMFLCLGIALANGLSFTNSPLDVQGLTDLIFSIFLVLVLFAMLDQQVIPRFTAERDLFEARERRNKSYSWVVFITANILVEAFWQTIAGILVFVTWYFPTGMWRNSSPDFSSAERAGLTFVLIWLFCLFISTLSHAVAIGIPLADTGVQMASLLYWFSLMFCGILAFPTAISRFWFFVYRATPFTYLMNGLLAAGLADTHITCAAVEQLPIELPPSASGQTCGSYLGPFVAEAGGYVVNSGNATGPCLYCAIDNTNDFFSGVGIDMGSRWRNVGFLAVYVAFNILATYAVYWLARVPRKGGK